MYMANGYLPSADGTELYFYASGQPFTHGSDGAAHTWGSNTGVRLLRLRRDGFVAVEAGYGDWNAPPTLTTVEMSVPVDCAPPNRTVVPGTNSTRLSGGVQLLVNMQTSVVGSVAVGVHGDSGPYALANANAVVGNSLDAAASWGGGGGRGADAAASFTSSLSALAGQSVAFEVAMRDAKLFSLELRCGGEKK